MLKKIKNNPWPYAIIAYFVVFIGAMTSWVVFAVQNDMELERADYYEHEMCYQSQIDRLHRTAAIRKDVQIQYSPDRDVIALTLPREHLSSQITGEIHLYRPSDSKLDRKLPLKLAESGTQQINVAGLPAGLWKLRVSWATNGDEHYVDHPVVLANH